MLEYPGIAPLLTCSACIVVLSLSRTLSHHEWCQLGFFHSAVTASCRGSARMGHWSRFEDWGTTKNSEMQGLAELTKSPTRRSLCLWTFRMPCGVVSSYWVDIQWYPMISHVLLGRKHHPLLRRVSVDQLMMVRLASGSTHGSPHRTEPGRRTAGCIALSFRWWSLMKISQVLPSAPTHVYVGPRNFEEVPYLVLFSMKIAPWTAEMQP